MSTVFADTFYFLGLLNRSDESHSRCKRLAAEFDGHLLSTDYVVLEVADALATPNHRVGTARFLRQLRATFSVRIIPASENLPSRALDLYEARPDKEWSLTDCTSFVVMQEHELTDAATGDRHFEQAGFKALLM